MGGWDGNGAWLSVELSTTAEVALVALYSYKTRGGMELSPFELWLGDSHGDLNEKCAGPIDEQPDVGGSPLYVPCEAGGSAHRFVTLKQVGRWRALFLSEMAVYVRSDADTPSATRPSSGAEIVARIQQRFDDGFPSNEARTAGVLFHKFDNYEMPGREWELCVDTPERFCPSPVDHVSCSIVNRDRPHPWGYGMDDYVGVLLAADTPLLCGYFGDVGTGGAINGACGFCTASGCVGGGRGYDVAEAIRLSDGQNEIIVGQLHWAAHQPDIFEAIVYLSEEGGRAHAMEVHARFLAHFGLTASQLPLVRYDWGSGTFSEAS